MEMVAYRHDIDDIIIRSLAWSPGGWMYGEDINTLAAPATSKMLFEWIKRIYPTISKATLQGHLDKMIKHDILGKHIGRLYPSNDAGTGKRTFYALSRNTYVNIRDNQRFPRIRSNREPRTK